MRRRSRYRRAGSTRGSHVFHDRSYCAWCRTGNRLSTTLPNSAPRRCRAGAMTQPMPSAAPSSACLAAARPGADDLLQRDDVGVEGGEHRGDALGPVRPSMPAAAVDVVGGDADGAPAALAHRGIGAQRTRLCMPELTASDRAARSCAHGEADRASAKSPCPCCQRHARRRHEPRARRLAQGARARATSRSSTTPSGSSRSRPRGAKRSSSSRSRREGARRCAVARGSKRRSSRRRRNRSRSPCATSTWIEP